MATNRKVSRARRGRFCVHVQVLKPFQRDEHLQVVGKARDGAPSNCTRETLKPDVIAVV
jgi:hypothetical protein